MLVLINKKIVKAFELLDNKNSIPDEARYVDNYTIFSSVVCNYSDVDPNTNDAMEKCLLKLRNKSTISNLNVFSEYDPNIHHHMNEKQTDGLYETLWDYKTVK